MPRAFATLFVLLCALPIGAQPKEPPIFSAPLQPLTPSRKGVVFPAKLAREFGQQCSRASPFGYWSRVSPSKNEIKALEAALPRFLTANRKIWRGQTIEFRFQFGALERGGKRFIYVNALPLDTLDKRQVWRRGAEVVCDGGPQFWGAEWDVRAKKFQNASFNGPA